MTIGLASMKLGGGREQLDDVIDMSAGIVLNKKVGDHVNKDELLCTLHTNKSKDVYEEIVKFVESAYIIQKDPVNMEDFHKEVLIE